jgi:Permuted papain-like amidase enzyme, YaeF/YiiX, C92 family
MNGSGQSPVFVGGSFVQWSTPVSLEADLARVAAIVARPIVHPHELEANLRQVYHAVFDLNLEQYDPAEVAKQSPALMKTIFNMRTQLRDNIADWQARGFMTRPVEIALRSVFRIARYANDMLGETGIGHAHLKDGEVGLRAFAGTDHNTQVHPKFDNGHNIAFQSGDVLVVRGSAHNSAAIARIGDSDSLFSHTAIVYVDPAGKHWVVEALIEDGSVINTLEHFLEHGIGRAVVYRHKDMLLAARAAEIAYRRILATKTGEARHIPYDFSMRLRGRRKLFCAKLIRQAFLDASGGKVVLPRFKTHFNPKSRSFYKEIGVRAKQTYAPGDIDLEPSFDLVAEWQDYRVTSRLRRQDMIMTKFFEWIEQKGWRFQEDFFIKLIAVFGRLSSYLSNRAKTLMSSVIPKVPRNMRRSCIATIAMLHKSAEELMPGLKALEDDRIAMHGRPLHPRDLLAHIESMRRISDGRIGYLVGKV